jgi:nucleoside-diphosphate-sugar epimerase
MDRHFRPKTTLLVTGADGRVGRLLRSVWCRNPPDLVRLVWTSRHTGPWRDLLAGPLDPAPDHCIILHLAAALSPVAAAAQRSVAMAHAVATAARQGRAKHILFASSMAVYAPTDTDSHEMSDLRAPTRYGRAKCDAEWICRQAAGGVPVTALRLGNVLGADALTATARKGRRVWLDPVLDRAGGPLRSWIAPMELARVLGGLIDNICNGESLPDVLNVASPGPVAMGDILDAMGTDWHYGPPSLATRPRVTMSMARLNEVVPLYRMSAHDMVSDWQGTLLRAVAR